MKIFGKFRNKLIAGFGLFVGLVLALFFSGFMTIRFTSTSMNELISETLKPLAQISRLQLQAEKIRRLEAELPYLDDFFAVAGIIDNLSSLLIDFEHGLRALIVSPDQQGNERRDLLTAWQLYRKEIERVLQLTAKMELQEAKTVSLYVALPRYQVFAGILDELSLHTEKLADQRNKSTLGFLYYYQGAFVWLSIVCIGLVAAGVFYLSRSLSSRISKLSLAAKHLAEGHFEEVTVEGHDEIKDLAESLNTMRLEIKKHQDHLEEQVRARTAQLESAKEQAETANAAKSDFLARMSHEIRTPINIIIGLTNIVLKSSLTSSQRDRLGKVQIASRNLLEVINDILDFSKVEAGRLDLEQAAFDLDQLMGHLADLFSERTSSKQLELILAVHSKVPRLLKGDPVRLTQMLTNLIENAVKFTNAGEIAVGVDILPAAESQSPASVMLEFWVRDTGIGIAAEVLPTLFEPFVQAGRYLTRSQEGAGLGLAICRRLSGLMGGRIKAESTLGVGSTFSFTALLEAQPVQKPSLGLPADLRGFKALVVDDSDTARQVLAQLLEAHHFTVTALDSGEKALEVMRQSAESGCSYDLILLDWKMPGMDGLEVARRIRETNCEKASSKTPIIILITAYGREVEQRRLDKTPVDLLLDKPARESQLLNAILTLFGRSDLIVPDPQQPQALLLSQRPVGQRVLLVEDNLLNQEVAVELLNALGVVTETAANGLIAVEKVTKSRPGTYAAVFMDVQMPVMDGYQAVKEIREYEKQQAGAAGQTKSRLPVIALTAHALNIEKQKCLEAGMDDYVAKPIDEQCLQEALLKWLPKRLQEETAEASRQEPSRPGPQVMSDATAALDVENALRLLGGRKHIYLKLLRSFPPECSAAFEKINRSLEGNDFKSAEITAHSIKGAAAAIGARNLFQAAAELEQALTDNGSFKEQLLSDFKKEMQLAIYAVEQYVG